MPQAKAMMHNACAVQSLSHMHRTPMRLCSGTNICIETLSSPRSETENKSSGDCRNAEVRLYASWYLLRQFWEEMNYAVPARPRKPFTNLNSENPFLALGRLVHTTQPAHMVHTLQQAHGT